MNVIVPARFDYDTLDDFFNSLAHSEDLDNVGIDFSRLHYSLPIGMLVAGSKLRAWWLYRNSCGYNSFHYGIDGSISAHSYLMHMGFFDFIYCDQGNRIGQARGSSSYLPITRITRPQIEVVADAEEWFAKLTEEARRIAGVLVGSHDDTEQLRTYSYCIREIIRNVFEHSEADECYICGQRWWDGKVEIAIVDEGIGISRSLRESHGIHSDRQAILLAVQPGVSRTNFLPKNQNLYDNSGFGLYVLTELAASFGWFTLGSGTTQLFGHQRERFFNPLQFQGTFFGMQLFTSPRNFRSVLHDIIEVGEQEAHVTGIEARASGRSRFIGNGS